MVLWDVRCQQPVGTLRPDGYCDSTSSSTSGQHPDRLAPCIGVQLDEWRMVTGFADGEHSIGVYDMRAATSSAQANSWREPVQVLTANARITSFQFQGENLLVGQEGADCLMWSFGPPGREGWSSGVGNAGAVAKDGVPSSVSPGDDGNVSGGGSAEKDRGHRKKKGPSKVSKKQTRYPKRNTR